MINLLLTSTIPQEANILKSAFMQKGIMVKIAPANGSTYLSIRGAKPHLIIVEMPKEDLEPMRFIEKIKSNKSLSEIPILSYGSINDQDIINRYHSAGSKKNFSRPLKFSILLKTIMNILKETLSEDELKLQEQGRMRKTDYYDVLLNPRRLGSAKLDLMTEGIDRAKAFPFTIAKIISLTEAHSTNIDDLVSVIETDSAMSVNTLKVSNSVFFSSRNRKDGKIKTIPEAIMRIGFDQTQKIAVSLMVAKLVNSEEVNYGFNRGDFWYHSLGCALVAEKLAKRAGIKNSSNAYMAGLLHEYGVILYDDYFSEIFLLMLENSFSNYESMEVSGKELIGITHTEFTNELFKKWNLSPDMGLAIKLHKKFLSLTNEDASKEVQLLSTIVGLSEIIVKSAFIGKSCDEWIYPIPDEVMRTLRMTAGITPDFFTNIYEEIQVYADFLKLDEREFPTKHQLADTSKPLRLLFIGDGQAIFEPHIYYLKNIGFEVVECKNEAQFKRLTQEKKYDLLIINTTEDKPFHAFERYLEIIETRLIPRIIFMEQLHQVQAVEDEHTRKLIKHTDLRKITEAIEFLFPQQVLSSNDVIENDLVEEPI